MTVTLGILHDISNREAYAMTTINNEFGSLELGLGVMLGIR
jgi:hypothetical protein